ncbi:hypothetical protein D3C85_1618910 [compost metagenome]
MTQSDAAPIRIYLRAIILQPKLSKHSQSLTRKCLIELDHVELVYVETQTIE